MLRKYRHFNELHWRKLDMRHQRSSSGFLKDSTRYGLLDRLCHSLEKEFPGASNILIPDLTPELEKTLREMIDEEVQGAITKAHAEEALDDNEDY